MNMAGFTMDTLYCSGGESVKWDGERLSIERISNRTVLYHVCASHSWNAADLSLELPYNTHTGALEK